MTHTEILRETMKAYHDKRGWFCIPCFLEINPKIYGHSKKMVDFGFDNNRQPRKWTQFVPQLPHMLDALDTFKSRRLGLPANSLALLTGKISKLFVLDSDDDKEAYKFLSSIGIDIRTANLSVESPSGKGSHVYYKWDDRLDSCKTTLSKFFGKEIPIDVRGDGGLIFCPPSRVRVYHEDGTASYRVYKFSKLEGTSKPVFGPPPENLVKYLVERVKERENRSAVNAASCTKTISTMSDKQKNVLEGVVKKLSEEPKGTRSEACFNAVCTFIRFQVAPDDAWESLKNVSKFAERDRVFFNDMWTNALSQAGESLPKGVEPPTPQQKAKALVGKVTADDLLNHKYVHDAPEVIGSPFYKRSGLSMICGDPSVGKTTMALDIARAAAVGGKCWGDQVDFLEPRKVLFFHGDLNAGTFIPEYVHTMGLDPDGSDIKFMILSEMQNCVNKSIDIDSGANITLFELLSDSNRTIYREIVQKVKPDIVILDTISSFMSGDQNDQKVMQTVLIFLKYISGLHKMHTIVLHHSRKRSTEVQKPRLMVLDDIRGSSAIAASCDFIFGFSNVYNDEGEQIKGSGHIHPIKEGSAGRVMRAFEPFTYLIGNDPDSGHVRLSINYDRSAPQDTSFKYSEEDNLIKIFREVKNGISYKELRDALCRIFEIKIRQAERKIADLTDDGFFDRNKNGRNIMYSLTDKGASLLPVETGSLQELLPSYYKEDDVNKNVPQKTDDERADWYADRNNWDTVSTIDDPGWDSIKLKYSVDAVAKTAASLGKFIWFNRDKFGNLYMSDIKRFTHDEGVTDSELIRHIMAAMIRTGNLWFKLLYDGDAKNTDVVLHPVRGFDLEFVFKK